MKSNVRTGLVVVLGLGMAIGAICGLVWFVSSLSQDFESQVDTYTFERNVRENPGQALDPDNIKALDSDVLLSEIFSEERANRYGADLQPPDGVGLSVTFLWRSNGNIIREESFNLPAWEEFEQTSNHDRRKLVEQMQGRFEVLVDEFTKPVSAEFVFAFVVDTTEGVGDQLRQRVEEVFQASNYAELSSSNDVTGYFYRIDASAYQGRRQKADDADGFARRLEWLLSDGESPNSSVYEGLRAALHELSREKQPEVLLFTDGLENTPSVSVYKQPALLDEGSWSKLDEVWDPASLDLGELQIRLFPLPPQNTRHEELMSRGLDYLEDRLTAAGATVVREPF